MRIAVCFSGQIRTGNDVAFSIKNYIGDLWNDCDFFVHTWNMESESPHLRDKEGNFLYSNTVYNYVDTKKLSDFYSFYLPKIMVVDRWDEFTEKKLKGTVFPIYKTVYEANKLKKHFEKKYKFFYDYVVRIRPDLIINSTKSLRNDINQIGGNEYKVVFADHLGFNKNEVGAFEGLFWIGKSKCMDIISDFYKFKVAGNQYKIPWHAHHKIINETFGIEMETMNNNKVGVYHMAEVIRCQYVEETEILPKKYLKDFVNFDWDGGNTIARFLNK